MKSQTNIYWTIGAFLIILITTLVFVKLFPRVLNVVTEIVSKTSSEIVSRELSNLITISGAAPNQIEIVYNPTKSKNYSVTLSKRIVSVKSESRIGYLKQSEIQYPIAVPLKDFRYEHVNYFIIRKIGESYYFKADSK